MIISHISDIHWRGLSRHAEYRAVFNKFFEACKERKPDMIVVGGDIVHSKTQGISPEIIENLNWWFTSLANIAPTHVILGNHDGLIMNKSRQDAITPILSGLANPNIFLYKKSGTYDSGYPGVKFCVLSCFDEEGWKDVKPDPDSINIALFHGAVLGAQTDSDWDVGHEIDVDFFRSYDFAMLGDIHRCQYLDLEKRIAYPGSTIQQNYGEAIEKGFLIWDIKSKQDYSSEFIPLENSQPFVTVDWQGTTQKTFEIAKRYPATSRFRIRFTGVFSSNDIASIQSKLHADLKPTEVVIKDESKRDSSLISTSKLQVERKSIRDPAIMRQFLVDYFESAGVKVNPKRWDEMGKILERYLARASEGDEIVRDTLWEIKKIQFNNTFAYGENNEIDFDSLGGITGIFGKNRRGKSSIIGTLVYALFNTSDRGSLKNQYVINSNRDYCDAKVSLVVNGEQYTAHRCTTKHRPKKGGEYAVTSLNFFKGTEEEDLSDEQRRETEKVLRNLIGTSEDFLMTSLASQGQINSFIGEKATARKSILSKFLDLEIFEKMVEISREDISPLKAQTKNKSTDDLIREISVLASAIVDLESDISGLDVQIQSKQEDLDTLVRHASSTAGIAHEHSSVIQKRIDKIKSEISDNTKLLDQSQLDRDSLSRKLDKVRKIKDDFSIDEINNKIQNLRNLEKTFDSLRSDLRAQQIVLTNKINSVKRLDEVPCGDAFLTCKFIKDSHEDRQTLESQRSAVNTTLLGVAEIQRQVEECKGENPEDMLKKYNTVLEMEKSITSEINMKDVVIKSKDQRISDLSKSLKKESASLEKSIEIEAGIDPSERDVAEQIQSLKAQIRTLSDRKISSATSLGKKTGMIEAVRESLENLEIAIDKFETLETLQSAFSKRGIPLQIMNSHLPAINSEIASILQGVVGFTVELEADLDSNSMDIFINYGDSRRVIELASGMEKMMSSMAIRVALINISSLPKTNMLIIDEGFGALDDTNIEACAKLLESFKRWFKNIIVISHVDAIKDVVDNVIEINWEDNHARVVYN
jgi:DNA repair exonuclease SbcCD ATPase subunit